MADTRVDPTAAPAVDTVQIAADLHRSMPAALATTRINGTLNIGSSWSFYFAER